MRAAILLRRPGVPDAVTRNAAGGEAGLSRNECAATAGLSNAHLTAGFQSPASPTAACVMGYGYAPTNFARAKRTTVPAIAPASAQAKPISQEMMISRGQRLCAVESCAQSTITRAMTAAGTAAAIVSVTFQNLAPTKELRANVARQATESPGVSKASGRLILL